MGFARPDLRFERLNLGSKWPDLISVKSDLRSGRPDLGSERLDLGPGRSDLGSVRPYLGSKRPYLGSEGLHLQSGRPVLRLRGGENGQTDGKQKLEKIALCGIIGHQPL